ncbi:MAG: hypothetical protein P1U36_09890 [Legionellaceae bacterium]|nr:hypothetical protein [Legionellaceae bacterium]
MPQSSEGDDDKVLNAISDIQNLLVDSAAQLKTLAGYAMHDKDKEKLLAMSEKIKKIRSGFNSDNGDTVLQNIRNSLNNLITEALSIKFEGKGGTTEEKEQRNFLSGLFVKVAHLALDAVNFLISLATFGKTDKFFRKTPTEAELDVFYEQWEALRVTNNALNQVFEELDKPNHSENQDAPGLGPVAS